MRAFQRTLLVLILTPVCGHVAWAQNNQNNETFSAGSGGAYDASVCNDPQIPIEAAEQKATPYHDPNWNTPGDPLAEALNALAQKYPNSNINRAGACEHAPGVVFMVPNNLVPQVTTLIAQIEASQPGGDVYSGSGNKTPSGEPSGSGPVGGGTSPNGGPPVNGGTATNGGPAASGTPCEPNYDMSTPAGRAAAMQNAAQTKQACDEYRCKHNPELSICQNIGVPGPAALGPQPKPIVPGPAAPAPQPKPIVPGPATPAPQLIPIVPGPAAPAPQLIPIVPGPAGPAQQPRGPGTPVPGSVMPTFVPSTPASVPPAATPQPAAPPAVNPGPAQQVNLWKDEFKCDGKNCVFVDVNGNRWGGPQLKEYVGGWYQIDPTKFLVIRIRTSNQVQSLATFRLIKTYSGTPPSTMTMPFEMLH